MGKPWVNFMDNVKAYYEVCRDAADEDILAFVDGFDSEIVRSEKELPMKKIREWCLVSTITSKKRGSIRLHATLAVLIIDLFFMMTRTTAHRSLLPSTAVYASGLRLNSGPCGMRCCAIAMKTNELLNILYSRGAFPFMGVDTTGTVIVNLTV